jgi:AcrR family transcriptional regulator
MAEHNPEQPDLVILAFQLVAERGWYAFSFTELARRAKVPLVRVYAELPDRASLLRVLARRLDAQMLDVGTDDLDAMTPRERVFELIMRRLDAMAPYKEGLRAVSRETAGDLDLLAAGCGNIGRLSRWLVDVAGMTGHRTSTALGLPALAAIYVRAFNVWLEDDTPDLARTLAELDRRLRQAENLARWVPGCRRRPPEASAEPASAPG